MDCKKSKNVTARPTIINAFIYFTLGFVVFSPYYVHLPFPFNSFELMFISFCIFYRKYLDFNIKHWKKVDVIGLVFLILFILGIYFNDTNGFVELYQMSRAWILIMLFAYIFYRSDLINPTFLYWTAFGSVIGGILMGIHGLQVIISEDENITTYLCPNIIAMPFFVYLSFSKKILWRFITFLALFTMGTLSQTRGIFLYCVLTYIISYIVYSMVHNKKILNKYIVFIVCGFISIYLIYQKAEHKINDISPYLHYRLYDKVNEMGNNESDNNRISAYMYCIDKAEDYILPHGFYLRRGTMEWIKVRAIGVNDSGLLELIHTFGWILFSFILYKFLSYQRHLYANISNGKKNVDILLTVSLFIPFSLLMGYAIFSAPFTACFWGIYIAMLRTTKKYI